MFDSVVMAGPKDALLCAAGHELRNFQTKDLDCAMNTYYVFEGCVYEAARDGWSLRQEPQYLPGLEGLAVISRGFAAPVGLSVSKLDVYTSCEECLPVLFEGTPHAFSDQVHEQRPWVEYELEVDRGRVVSSAPVKLESRDDVRKKGNWVSIPDDDRVAKRHFERLKEKGTKG